MKVGLTGWMFAAPALGVIIWLLQVFGILGSLSGVTVG